MPPAARVADPTTHGAPLAPGPGSTDVLIGYMPAWRAMIDQHACPMVSITGPDGVGMVMMGSPTVLIDFMMACRQGDIVMEIPGLAMGPANPIIMGCPTVQIGEVGMGGAATGMGMGMSMAKSSAVGTTSQNPSTLSQPASPQALVAVPASFTAPTPGSLQWDIGSGGSGGAVGSGISGAGGSLDQGEQKGSDIVCGIVPYSLEVTCQHHRHPKDGVLEVVPSQVGGDTIDCKLKTIGTCGPHPLWEVMGELTDQTIPSKNEIKFEARPNQTDILIDWIPLLPLWLGDVVPDEYAVTVSSCSGPSFAFLVRAFPNTKQELAISSATYEKIIKSFSVNLTRYLKPIVGDVTFEALVGSGRIAAQWKEDDKSNLAFYSWYVSVGFNPLLAASFRLPLLALPPVFSEIGLTAGVFFEIKGEINIQANGGRVALGDPNDPDPIAERLEVKSENSIQLSLMISAYHGDKDDPLLEAEAALTTGVYLTLTAMRESHQPLVKMDISIGGLKGTVTLKYAIDIFGLESKASYNLERTFFEPYPLLDSYKWHFFSDGSDASEGGAE